MGEYLDIQRLPGNRDNAGENQETEIATESFANRAEKLQQPEWLDIEMLEAGTESLGGMVVRSTPMRQVMQTVARLGPYKATVLVHGESGTARN